MKVAIQSAMNGKILRFRNHTTWNPWIGLDFKDKTEHCLTEVSAEGPGGQLSVEVVGDGGEGDVGAADTVKAGVT